MPYPPDAEYFIYLYVFTCEQCNAPYLETRTVPLAPRDEIEQTAASWTCENCSSPQCIAGDRSAVYARSLLVKNGTCFVRHNMGTQPAS